MSRFGEFIDARCKELGITHGEFEERAGLSYGIASRYIYGTRIPQAVSLIKTMSALELNNNEILEVVNALKQDLIEKGEVIEWQ